MPGKQWSLLTDDAALVPGDVVSAEGKKKINGHGSTSCPPGPPFFGLSDASKVSR